MTPKQLLEEQSRLRALAAQDRAKGDEAMATWLERKADQLPDLVARTNRIKRANRFERRMYGQP